MNHVQEPGKRIVSKGEHVQALIERAVVSVVGFGLYLSACLLGLAVLYCICSRIYDISHHRPSTFHQVRSFWTLFCVSPFALYFFVKMGQINFRYASTLDVGLPLTRANIGDLPAPDSLVRASEEPMQTQHAVLLRAAEGQETPPEQLVRAVNGQ